MLYEESAVPLLSRIEAPALEDDAQLVRAAIGGDPSAMSALYARHRGVVVARLSRLRGPGPEVDDLAQETFLRAYRALRAFRGDGPFRAWLLRIATHTAQADHRRARRSIWRLFAEPAEEASLEPRVPPQAEAYPDRVAVRAALDRLPSRLREAVVLFELEGKTLEEIAGERGLSINTVAARVRRGREALRRAIVIALFILVLIPAVWAWVSRRKPPAPPPPALTVSSRVARVAPRDRIAASTASTASTPPPLARPKRARPKPPAPVEAAPVEVTGDRNFVEPEGDVIFVKTTQAQPPLFSVEEYKSRGVLVP